MTVFKTILKILNRLKGMLILYTVMLISITMINQTADSNINNFEESKPDMLIVNKDNDNIVTNSFINYINKHAEIKNIDINDEEKINDAIFYRDVNYVIYIPENFGENILNGEEPITLYIPTLERDANVKAWAIARLQENRNRKIDNSFIRFLLWLAPKISKDLTIAQKQIREYEMIYKSWDTEMFSFMDDVLRNIIITPSQKITTICPICGEEMTSDIRFQHSVRDLFNVSNKFKKFGKK